MQHAKTMSAVAALAIFAACGWAHSLAAGDAAPSAVQPLLSGGNPDPTICRVGDDYYIATSSFSLSPGLPVYRSKDMVNWEVISHAWRESWPCKAPDDGIWAPTLRHHNGVFYLTVTWHDGFKKAENYLLTARDPAGPWSKPMKIDAKSGIDGSLFFDGEDAWYLSNQQPSKQKWRGHCQIWMQRIDLATGRLFGERHVLTDGFGDAPAFAEGPHLYKIGGKYLLLHAQGGTAWGHEEIALVSDSVTGQYVPVAGNPVLTAKDWGRRSPLQSLGHADLVQTPGGEWCAVFLGMRMTEGGAKCPLGRETFSCRVDLDGDGLPTRFRRDELIAGTWSDPAATRYSLLDRFGDPARYVKVRDLSGRVDYPDKPFRFCAALAGDAPLKGASAADPVQKCESDVTSRVIRNDAWWNTVDGKPIYSNGGGCYFYEGRWYWYGCRYEEAERVRFDSALRVDAGGLHTTFVGVTCYSSDDLVNWRDEGIVYAGEGAESEAHGRWFGRAGVAAVPSEGKFVLAMQYMGGVLLAVADSPRGPFVFQEGVDMSASTGYRTTGDQSVFYDDIHGKGYLVFSKPHGRDKTYVADLGYRNGRAFVGAPRLVFAGHGREGNCMFMHRGKYYICASDLYGWDGSRAYWMVADSPMGPYRKSSDGDMFLMRNAVEDYCHVSQTGFFVTVRGAEQETVVFCGDRWTQFADNGIGFNVWTPLSFDGDEPVFNSLSEWSLDAATGRWAVGSGNNYVRNGSFDADRRQIPIRHKPDQDFVSGWTVEPAGGFLNATNMPSDKAFVTGKFALSLSAPFPRRAYQKIEDIPNGNYMLRYWRDDGKGWQRHEESVCVTNETYVVEFVATAPCRIDDASLIAAQAGAGFPNEIVAGGKLRGGFTLVPVKCHPGAAQPFRPFLKSYDDSGAKASANQVASPCEAALREGFANPPPDVKIGCYYYWVNERVYDEGVKKDLQWMKENGITRAFLATDIRNRTRFENPWEGQQFGDCTFRSEKWWRCLRTAFKTAGELGIEMGIFNCPGWSQSGGPWVAKEDAQVAPDGTYPKNGPCSPAATGYEIDKTRRAAVRRHFDAFVGEILRRIPPEERPTLTTVVVDSWERGRVVKLEGDPRKVSDIIAEEYMGELTRCAHENGLITWCEPYSHSRGGWDGDSATYGAAADEVSAEFWAGEPKNERAKEVKAALGAARLGGKNKIYAESFTAGSWTKFAKDDWSFESLKPYADKFFRKGVNATILHVVISQPGDETEPPVRPWFGTFFDRRSRNAAEMKKLVPYLRRCNFMLQQGRPADGRTDTRILPDGTRIRFTEQSLFEVVFPDGRTETWNPVSCR